MGLATRHGASHLGCVDRVAHDLARIRSYVCHDNTALGQVLDDLLLERVAAVITSDPDGLCFDHCFSYRRRQTRLSPKRPGVVQARSRHTVRGARYGVYCGQDITTQRGRQGANPMAWCGNQLDRGDADRGTAHVLL